MALSFWTKRTLTESIRPLNMTVEETIGSVTGYQKFGLLACHPLRWYFATFSLRLGFQIKLDLPLSAFHSIIV
jgi:hypothetical protein